MLKWFPVKWTSWPIFHAPFWKHAGSYYSSQSCCFWNLEHHCTPGNTQYFVMSRGLLDPCVEDAWLFVPHLGQLLIHLGKNPFWQSSTTFPRSQILNFAIFITFYCLGAIKPIQKCCCFHATFEISNCVWALLTTTPVLFYYVLLYNFWCNPGVKEIPISTRFPFGMKCNKSSLNRTQCGSGQF